MKLTKEQRNLVYRKALELYAKEAKAFHECGIRPFGLCTVIRNALVELGHDGIYAFELPEFKTKDTHSLSMYWWDIYDTESRMRCLLSCIHETN